MASKNTEGVTAIKEDKKQASAVAKVPTQSLQGEAEILIAQAINQNVPVETMEKLLAMRRELRAEKAFEQFSKAFAKLQSELPVVEKKSQAGGGSGFNYKFAPLEYIVEKVKNPIAENEFSYYFNTKQNENFMTIYCHVSHVAGHTRVTEFELPIDKSGKMNATQQFGSALTYGKRYAFCSAFGITVGGEDNDAKSDDKPLTPREMRQTTQAAPNQATPQNSPAKEESAAMASEKQVKYIRSLLDTKGYTEAVLLKKYKVEKIEDISSKQASNIIGNLNKLANAAKKTEPVQEEQVDEEPIDNDEVDKGIQAQHAERATA